MNSLTKYLVDSILNDEPTEDKSIFLSKEVIEEWVVSYFPQFINEVSQVLGRPEVDDGPNFFFPNHKAFEKVSKKRAEHIGYTVFKQISDKRFEDYYEHPIYPKGPVKAVTPFPAGVIGKITATNQKDYASSVAYSKWYNHVTRAMALAGYSIVRSKDEIEKRLATKNAEGSKQLIGQKNKLKEGLGLAMGYPSKEDLEKKDKELKRLRKKFDKEKEMREEMDVTDKGGTPYVVDLEDLTKDNTNFRTTKWTGIDLQMTLMSIEVGGDIGLEVHEDGDQFLRIEDGEGKVVMGKDKDNLDIEIPITDDYAILIPQGYWHNIINTGDEPLKLYALYAPPEHPTGKVDMDKPVNEDEIKTFKTSLGLDREELPQIKKEYMGEFVDYLKENGKKVWGEYLNTGELKMTQSHINSDLVKELMNSDKTKLQKPIIVSEDNYIMDGHHRCVALYNLDENSKIKGIKVGVPIGELLELGRSFPKAESKEIDEMSVSDLSSVERYADSQLDPADVEFTKHFFDRVVDPRNIKPISAAELIGFFKRLAQKKKPFIDFLKKYNQFVVTDKRTDINIPFVKQVNQIIAKTIMRKRGFMTSNPRFTVETIKKVGDKYVVYPKKGGDRLGTHDTLASAKKQLAAIEISKHKHESLFGGEGGMKPHDKMLMAGVVRFMQNKLGFSGKVIVKKKSSSSLFGDISLSDASSRGKFTLHYNPNYPYERIIKNLIHELIHAKQIAKGELKPSSDYKELLWKGKPFISVKDYSNFQRKDIDQYKKLPWEREAYEGMDKFYRMFLNSGEFKELVGKNPNLDYILSNLNKTIKHKDINEEIKIPVEIGDTILTGRFKNKKVVVKSIGKDEHGMPTINGKKVVTFRTQPKDKVNEGVVDGGEPETGYIADGQKRVLGLNSGRPEYWFEQGGYTQIDFPKADAMRGRGKFKDKETTTRKVYYKVQNVKKSTLKTPPKDGDLKETMKIYIHDTDYKHLLENLVNSNKNVKLLDKNPLNENKGKIEEMYLTTPKDALTELVIWETFKIISESGSFPGVEDVPSGLANAIVGDFLKSFVLPTKAVDPKTVVGIGSTRSILQKLPNAKKVSGDLDLLAVANGDRKSAVDRLVARAKSMKMAHRVAFGNVFSVAYPYKDKLYQVDLMVAEASDDNAVYSYMKKFKYWSDEDPVQDTSFIIKGAHRSELAKTIVKAVGLSAAESSFTEYIWNDEFSKTQDVAADLEAKASRFRDKDKKEQTLAIADILRTKITDMKRLKNLLADEDGFVKNRFPHSIFKNYDKGYGLLLSIVFDKVEEKRNWETILDKKFGITNSIERMNKFDDVMNLIKELLTKRVLTPRSVVNVFKEMKQNFDTGRAAGRWNRALEEYIEQRFPFLKGRW